MHCPLRFLTLSLAVLSLLTACSSPTSKPEFELAVVRLEPLQSDLFSDAELDLTSSNLDPKSKKIINDKNAFDGRAAALYRSGEGVRFKLKNVANGTYRVSVRARGQHYQGWPIMRSELGGERLGKDKLIDVASYRDINLGELYLKNDQTFKLSFRNDHWGGRPDRDRNLYIDHLTLTPIDKPTPPDPSVPLPTPPKAYYISPDGNDANDGLSPDKAWRTLGKLRKVKLKDGYPVLLKRGSMFRETLHVPRSGRSGVPFVISTYGEGAAPVISGADLVSGWRSEGHGRYSAALATKPQRVWHAASELKRGEHSKLSEGQFAYANGRLYVRLANSKNPQRERIEASVRESAVRDTVGWDYVRIENIVGEKTNGATRHDAVFNAHQNSDHWTILNSVARYGAANGFFGENASAKGVGSHLLLKNSEAAHNVKRGVVAAGNRNTGQVFDGLYAHHNLGDGLLINSRGGILKNSRLNHNGLVSGGKPKHGFYMYPWKGGASSWQIFDNELRGNRDSGGRIAGTNARFYRNTVSENRYGIFIVDNDGENAGHLIEDNLFHKTHPWAHSVELEGAENVTVRNNSFIDAFGVGLINGKKRANRDITLSANVFGGDPASAFVSLDPLQDQGFSQTRNCFDAGLTLNNARTRRQAFWASDALLAQTLQTPPSLQIKRRQHIPLPECGSGRGG